MDRRLFLVSALTAGFSGVATWAYKAHYFPVSFNNSLQPLREFGVNVNAASLGDRAFVYNKSDMVRSFKEGDLVNIKGLLVPFEMTRR